MSALDRAIKGTPPPTQSRELADHTPTSTSKDGENRWETYWRAGYTVAGAPPVLVNEYGRTHADAVKVATERAKVTAQALADANTLLSVTPWVQPWQVRTVHTTKNYEWQMLAELKPSCMDVEDGVVRARQEACEA